MYARADANSPNADALKSMPESHPSIHVCKHPKERRERGRNTPVAKLSPHGKDILARATPR